MANGFLFLSQAHTASAFTFQDLRLLLVALCAFILLALSSKQIGEVFSNIGLPRITGFLFAGILIGPFVLNLLPKQSIIQLQFLDQISLAMIALVAGSELQLHELRSKFKSILLITSFQFLAVFGLGSIAIYFASQHISFMAQMPTHAKIAASMLMAAIMVTRSPSSAVALITELRAKGPFTLTLLGVTMLADVAVIILFAICLSVAKTLMSGRSFNSFSILLILLEIALAVGLGYLFSRIFQFLFSFHFHRYLKRGLILLVGYSVFLLDQAVHQASQAHLSFSLHIEPLLTCVITGFFLANFNPYRAEFTQTLHKLTPPVFLAFFTLTGASLGLDVLSQMWTITLFLVFLRMGLMLMGSWVGGVLAGDPPLCNRLRWMVFITQAGVGLGLTKQMTAAFPTWGTTFAALLISMIIVDEIIGPPLFKWAIHRVGEAHTRAETPEFDGVRDALIFGFDGRTVALARSLKKHGWNVKIATLKTQAPEEQPLEAIQICRLPNLSIESFRCLEIEKVESVVMMLQDDENYQAAEIIYEHFGTKSIVVLLHDHKNFERFKELGTLIVEPGTAIINLFDNFVRSPLGTSFLLGLDERQDVLDLEVRDPQLDGLFLRELTLPPDVLVLSVTHKGKQLISHGYTQLEIGDQVSVIGSPESLEKVSLMFEQPKST